MMVVAYAFVEWVASGKTKFQKSSRRFAKPIAFYRRKGLADGLVVWKGD